MRILLIAVLTLAACAAPAKQTSTPRPDGPQTNGAASDPDADNVECQNEAPTGSLIQHGVCRDKFERDGNRRNAEDWAQKSRSQPLKGN